MGRFVDGLGGSYIIAEDVGTSPSDLAIIGETTIHTDHNRNGAPDPSPATALGVFLGIRAAAKFKLGRTCGVAGLTVAIQGLGHVGYDLARRLHRDDANLVVSDINRAAVDRVVDQFGAVPVEADQIYDCKADIFAPCALGGTINGDTAMRLGASIIAGSANNQLADDVLGEILADRDILYAPDYVINAGGIISVAHGRNQADAVAKIEAIADTLHAIFQESRATRVPTNFVADRMAEACFAN